MKQCNIFDYCIVDSFAGGGGASTGIEMATGHPVDIAINHNEAAIMMHKRNHPFTEHYREDIWKVDPIKAVRGRHVRLAWFSPDCKHFSRAKGKALLDKKIRGLAWAVLKWAHDVKPDVIMLENVPEFVTWGPVRKGRPVKKKAGETYQRWLKQLKDLGYEVETSEECAADFGAPTIRTRFHLIARCDGRPIVWPKRTHAPRNSEEVKSGKCLPWRAAAEVINFDLPCPSIFDTKQQIKEKYNLKVLRPLKPNTLQRIARGLDKFVIKSAEPFIIPRGYGEKAGQAPRVHDINEPLPTMVGTSKHYVCDPFMTPYSIEVNHSGGERAYNLKGPLNTITAKHSLGIVDPVLAPFHMHNHQNAAGTDMRDPINTITSTGSQMLLEPKLAPYILQHKFKNGAQDPKAPLSTITAVGAHELVTPTISPYIMSNNSNNVPHGVDEPIPTITTGDRNYLTTAHLIQYHSEQSAKEVRGQTLDKPINTLDAANRYGLSTAYLVQYFSGAGHYHSLDNPMNTLTSMDREGLTSVFLSKFFTGVDGAKIQEPLPTVTAVDHNALTAVHLAHFKGKDKGQHPLDPMMTITSKDALAEIRTMLVKYDGKTNLHHWGEVRELLNEYCGYSIKDDEILLINILGIWWFISDIGLRMLIPREQYDAMGFPHDYIIDKDAYGNPITRTDQVARCGNAVCPQVAEALVRANLPELCPAKIKDMDELFKVMTS